MKVKIDKSVYKIGPDGKDSKVFNGMYAFQHNGESYLLLEELITTGPVNKYEYECVCYVNGVEPKPEGDSRITHWLDMMVGKENCILLEIEDDLGEPHAVFVNDTNAKCAIGVVNAAKVSGQIVPLHSSVLDKYLPSIKQAESPMKFLKSRSNEGQELTRHERVQVALSRFTGVTTQVDNAYEDDEITADEHDTIIRHSLGIRNALASYLV